MDHLLDLVEPADPVGGKKKLKRYTLRDPFFLFWYRFVFPHLSALEMGDLSAFRERLRADLRTHTGHIFERIVREVFLRRQGKGLLGVPLRFGEIGGWWDRREELDVVAWGERSRTTYIADVRGGKAEAEIALPVHGRHLGDDEVYVRRWAVAEAAWPVAEVQRYVGAEALVSEAPVLGGEVPGGVGHRPFGKQRHEILVVLEGIEHRLDINTCQFLRGRCLDNELLQLGMDGGAVADVYGLVARQQSGDVRESDGLALKLPAVSHTLPPPLSRPCPVGLDSGI